MKIKILNESPERTMAAVFDPGEEAAAGLLQIAREQNLTAARLTGIGALSRVVLGYFDLKKRNIARSKSTNRSRFCRSSATSRCMARRRKSTHTSSSGNPMALRTVDIC